MNKHRKIYNIPGLIHVLFLLIICFLFFNKYKAFEKQHGMELNLAGYKNIPIGYGSDSIHLRREFSNIILSGVDVSDNLKITYSEQILHKLFMSKDTINGVHYIFTEKSKYKSLIRIFDILKLEKINF
jgi:hypothetical protein